MNYKKLNEVDVIESMSDSGYVLGVDENGGIKRVPKPTLGKVKTVNGAEPDENGNIELEIETDGVKTVNGEAPDENGNIDVCKALKDVGATSLMSIDDFVETFSLGGFSNRKDGYNDTGTFGNECRRKKYEKAKVTYDGKEYICDIEYEYDGSSLMFAHIGNKSIAAQIYENTGEPFYFYYDYDMDEYILRFKVALGYDSTVTIQGLNSVTQTVPESLLPTPKSISVLYEYNEENNTIGGYTYDEVLNLLKSGCNVTFIKTAKQYIPPLCLTFCGSCGDETSEYAEGGWGSGLLFGAVAAQMGYDSSLDGDEARNISGLQFYSVFWTKSSVTEYEKRVV